MAKWIFVFGLLTIGLMLVIMWQAGLFTVISDAISTVEVFVTDLTVDVTDAVRDTVTKC